MTIDELRIIEHTNTQIRYLPIISQILRTIGGKSMSTTILKTILDKWSIEQERKSSLYRNHNGILTNNEKPTTAFPYYIELMLNLGLLSKINDVVRNSKYGILFLTLEKFNTENLSLSQIEKFFYLFFILLKDADNVILILQIINENNGVADYKYLREQYEIYLKQRLKLKAINSSSYSQLAISNKLRKVEFVWQNAKEYSKHIIPPRIEWLIDIGILQEVDNKKSKKFEFSDLGKKFYNSLEFIDDSKTKDINDLWLLDQFVYVFQFLCKKNNKITDFNTLDEASKIEFLSEIIPVAYKELDTDGMRRISGLPFYIFVMIIGVVQYNLSISFSSLKSKLLQSFTTHQFTFAFRESSRINESYLTVSINEL